MARAAAKRSQRAKQDARAQRPRERSTPTVEQTLFFSRLRRQAKWVFVFLALVFAGGFVFFGVGTGNSGLGDILNGNLFGGGSSSTPSIDKARERIDKNPNDAQGYRDLATALQVDQRNDEAIVALQKYVSLRPKDADALSTLATLYLLRAGDEANEVRAAVVDAQSADASPFGPAPTGPLGKALAAGSNPLEQAVSSAANERYNDAYSRLQTTFTLAEGAYTRVAALRRDDPSVRLQLADTAQRAGDAQTAIKAYKAFLSLAPDDPSAPYARQQIRRLQSQVPSSRGG